MRYAERRQKACGFTDSESVLSEAISTAQVVNPAHGFKARWAGKRSDPALKPKTIFVHKETQRRATRLLEGQHTGKDFSDWVEELVSYWPGEHSIA